MLIGNMLCKNILPFINSALSADKKVSIVLNGLLYTVVIQLRSCRNPLVCSQMFYKIDVLKTFAIFTGKHLRWILFLTKLQTPEKKKRNPGKKRDPGKLKKRHWHRCFLWIPRNFYEHLFLQNNSRDCFCL